MENIPSVNNSSKKLEGWVICINELSHSVASSENTIYSGVSNGFENIVAWKAYTPSNCDLDSVSNNFGISKKRFTDAMDYGTKIDNAFACFLSHFSLWQRCVEKNKPILILEHDALFTGSFPNFEIPDFKGLLSIGRPSYGSFRIPNKSGVNILSSKRYLPGAHAYIIKPDAASDLIKTAKQIPCATDVFISLEKFPWIQEYYPWIVVADDSFSTIQTIEKGLKPKHSFQKNPSEYMVLDV